MVSQEHESGLRYLTEHNMNKCNTTILKKNALDIAQLRHHDLNRTIIHTPHARPLNSSPRIPPQPMPQPSTTNYRAVFVVDATEISHSRPPC